VKKKRDVIPAEDRVDRLFHETCSLELVNPAITLPKTSKVETASPD
jgi:hypothetical protein